MAALSGALLLALTGCSSPQAGEEAQIGAANTAAVHLVDFDEVPPGSCLGGTGPREGRVPLVSCDEPGAIPVLAVVTVGQDAPASRPAQAVVNGYAAAACEDSVSWYAQEHSVPVTGLLQVAVVSDRDWQGSDTPVVCAVAETG